MCRAYADVQYIYIGLLKFVVSKKLRRAGKACMHNNTRIYANKRKTINALNFLMEEINR